MYKDIYKDVFGNEYEWSDIVKNHANFLRRMEEIKPYIVEFDQDGAMKPKVYFFDYAVGRQNRWFVIIITYNKCTFSVNNRVQKTWT